MVSMEVDGLRRVLALYLAACGAFMLAVAIRRRSGPAPGPEPAPGTPDKSGLAKAVDKLAEAKPFGFTLLAIVPLVLSFGGLSSAVPGLLMYLTSVLAMRPTDAELAAMVSAKPLP